MILIAESGDYVVKSRRHLGNAGSGDIIKLASKIFKFFENILGHARN